MSKKFKTPEEKAMHEEAVRLRRMTDKQLVAEFHRATEKEICQMATGKKNKHASIEALLDALSIGECKGIKSATVYKLSKFAEEKGFLG